MELTSIIETPTCFKCGKRGQLEIPTQIWFAGIKKSEEGALIQDAFPTLTTDEREQLLTGIHSKCPKEMFQSKQEA